MNEAKPLKQLLEDLAYPWNVSKKRIWDAFKEARAGANAGLQGWRERKYVQRPVTPAEAEAMNASKEAVVICDAAGARKPRLVLDLCVYRDKDQTEQRTAKASVYQQEDPRASEAVADA